MPVVHVWQFPRFAVPALIRPIDRSTIRANDTESKATSGASQRARPGKYNVTLPVGKLKQPMQLILFCIHVGAKT